MNKIKNLVANGIITSIQLFYVNRKIFEGEGYILYKYLLYDGFEYIRLIHRNVNMK